MSKKVQDTSEDLYVIPGATVFDENDVDEVDDEEELDDENEDEDEDSSNDDAQDDESEGDDDDADDADSDLTETTPDTAEQFSQEQLQQLAVMNLLRAGYKVEPPGQSQVQAPQQEEIEPPDRWDDPDGYDAWREAKLRDALMGELAPVVAPLLQERLIKQIQDDYSSFGFGDMPQAAVDALVKDVQATPLQTLQGYMSDEGARLRAAKHYVSSAPKAQKAVEPQKQKSVTVKGVASAPAPSGKSTSKGAAIPKEYRKHYNDFLRAFNEKDTEKTRAGWLRSTGIER